MVNSIVGLDGQTEVRYGPDRTNTDDVKPFQDESDLSFTLREPIPALNEDGFLCAIAIISDKPMPIEMLRQYWEDLGQV
jgi:hypothetical protein